VNNLLDAAFRLHQSGRQLLQPGNGEAV
jgi:hypothetical protein